MTRHRELNCLAFIVLAAVDDRVRQRFPQSRFYFRLFPREPFRFFTPTPSPGP
jgi:hypothetical protein